MARLLEDFFTAFPNSSITTTQLLAGVLSSGESGIQRILMGNVEWIVFNAWPIAQQMEDNYLVAP